jgi:tRNA (uracil-5-)-methyltransferase TRM9
VADNLSLPHPSGTFDFAISIAVVHHLSTPARRIEAVQCVLDILKTPLLPDAQDAQDGGKALIYVWALEQKDSRRGWDEGHEQDVMVPWVLKQKKEKQPKRSQRDKDIGETGPQEGDGDKTFLRYYHLYKKGELEQDIEQAGGVVLESGYEKDNWWAIATVKRPSLAPASGDNGGS